MGVELLIDLLIWLGVFLGNGDFTLWSGGGAFLSWEGNFPLWVLCGDGDFSFWSDGGAFLGEGDLIFFFWGRGSPLLGENKAFIAEPSDRPAINNGTPRELKG